MARFFEVHAIEFVFSLNLNLRLKAVSSNITTLISYCKTTFNVFFSESTSVITIFILFIIDNL